MGLDCHCVLLLIRNNFDLILSRQFKSQVGALMMRKQHTEQALIKGYRLLFFLTEQRLNPRDQPFGHRQLRLDFISRG